MSDHFVPIPLENLLNTILQQLNEGHYFGIPQEVFFTPQETQLETQRFGKTLQTPLGPAAGPHTQLSQNIVGAWLCGARYMELKTVQTLDELQVAKPCIDLQDEGYNCEWSQELRIPQSYEQYLDAWILIHLLSHHLQWGDAAGKTLFNMSVGYNLEGILKHNVQWFFEKMKDCSKELNEKISNLAQTYPWVRKVKIPTQISDSITLSTMHGCPPDEIEKIGMYLIQERGLHTVIKLNPTLLGPEKVRGILNDTMGFKTPVPDQAFEHDLKYADGLKLIKNLQNAADTKGVFFGLKLTNTLESNNFREVFAEEQKQMYMSGKSLHPLAVHLAAKIRQDFPGIDISFSAGADCFNMSDILSCGLSPVTVSSDLLKPGGYGRLSQYLCNLLDTLRQNKQNDVNALLQDHPNKKLTVYADKVLQDLRLKKSLRAPNIKTLRPLEFFDCIHAPCMSTCPGQQDIPTYMHYVSAGNWQKAFEVIMQTNPFPSVTGAVCDHECQTRCTRVHYDDALAIREIKRFVAGFEHDESFIESLPDNGEKAAIIGAGPAGLSCAWYLRLAGFQVDVFEASAAGGGMVKQVIPSFRLTDETIATDVERIRKMGVNISYEHAVDKAQFDKLRSEGYWIFAAIGAGHNRKLNIPGEDSQDVMEPLDFLTQAKAGKQVWGDAQNIIVLGGGNTAMDVARTAQKLSQAKVKILYRRTLQDMPAVQEEIMAVTHEGIEVMELTSPLEIISEQNKVKALKCQSMRVAGKDAGGRQKVEPIEDSEFVVEADMIIPAVGQLTQWPFATTEEMKTSANGFSTSIDKVYVGGDARAGAANIISAIADGKKAAEAIIQKQYKKKNTKEKKQVFPKAQTSELLIRKAQRMLSQVNAPSPDGHHKTIMEKHEAIKEASRCLLCDEVCNICVSVCPNFANQSYRVEPASFILQTAIQEEDGRITVEEDVDFSIEQSIQTYNIADFCNECGNCQTFCPTMGAPYLDKPKMHLCDESWKTAKEGFLITKNGKEFGIDFKLNESELHVLYGYKDGLSYTYKTPYISAQLNAENLKIENIRFLKKGKFSVSLKPAVMMHILLQALLNRIPE